MTRLFGKLAEHPAFSLFWEAYPRKEAKGRARPAFMKALKKVEPEKLLAAVRAYKFSPDKTYIPLPATWLNDERWLDQEETKAIVEAFDLSKFDRSVLPMIHKLRGRIGDAELLSWFTQISLADSTIRCCSRFVLSTIRTKYESVFRGEFGVTAFVVEAPSKMGPVRNDVPGPGAAY